MPGITVQLVPGADEAAVRRFASAQQLMLHAPDYQCVVHVTAEGCSVGHVAYPDYPIMVVSTATYTVCVEGRILSNSDASLTDALSTLAQAVLGEEPVADRVVQDWILAHEGDYFIVLVTNNGKRLCAVTDPLGRLPVYFAASDAGLWLGRECKFVLAAKGSVAFDRMGWAEQLWLGYPLAERTLFEGVKRACGGLLLMSRVESGRVLSAWRSLWTLNCEDKSTSPKPLREHAAELVETFVRSIDRGQAVAGGKVALSLSGGKDSRAIAAVLAKGGEKWIATTRLNADGGNRGDVEIAHGIAEALGVPWYLIKLGPTPSDDARRLVWLKDGLNYAGMSFILAYLERVSRQWGRMTTYVTGDGGAALSDLRLPHAIRGSKGLLKAIHRAHALIPASTAERIMGLDAGALDNELGDLVRGYPENDPVQKAVHFRIYERGRKLVFEGEDRNRYFLWQFSPFFSLSMYRLAMQIPDTVKEYAALYVEFEKQLNPTLAHLPDANYGLAIDSAWLPVLLRIRRIGRRLPVGLKSGIRRLAGLSSIWTGRQADGSRRRGSGRSVTIGTDSLMEAEETKRMLASVNERQRQNWQTLALLEELW